MLVRRPRVATGCAVAALLLAGACSGESEPEPETSAEAEQTSQEVSPQPAGAHGVTTSIVNWEDHHDNEAVVAWKAVNEATSASINNGELVDGFSEGYGKEVRQVYLDAFDIAWPEDMKVPTEGDVRIESAELDGDEADLVVCQWAPTTDYVSEDVKEIWRKQVVEMKKVSGTWKIVSLDEGEQCEGEAPQ
ncbi:hypothetical protein [Aeromicrobium sp. CTD01-1L150]|uniref:hypothetical protein n=1 Tax=Aeromicrobium sp. CTD01-1L150 TaxID=3341830 RepID=UPI0035C19703